MRRDKTMKSRLPFNAHPGKTVRSSKRQAISDSRTIVIEIHTLITRFPSNKDPLNRSSLSLSLLFIHATSIARVQSVVPRDPVRHRHGRLIIIVIINSWKNK